MATDQASHGPRVRGIIEHYHRIQLLDAVSRQINDEKAKYRLMVFAVYSCRGITELMLEAAEKDEVLSTIPPYEKVNRQVLEAELKPRIPFYDLIEKIRIHDFHRFGICPPENTRPEMFMGGPVKLTSKSGIAAMTLPASGPEFHTSGSATVKLQRPLVNSRGAFFDDDSRRFIGLPEILGAFHAAIPGVIKEFAKRVGS